MRQKCKTNWQLDSAAYIHSDPFLLILYFTVNNFEFDDYSDTVKGLFVSMCELLVRIK
jgi:hypothetical protein